MERLSRTAKKTDIRYASPDAIRPHPLLQEETIKDFGMRPNRERLEKIKQDFNRKFNTKPTPPSPRAPSPSQLPMPSQRLLTRRSSRSKSPKQVVVQGKNRKWTIKARKSSRPRTNSATRRRGRGKHRANRGNRGNRGNRANRVSRIRKP